jgi:hypothetical protein
MTWDKLGTFPRNREFSHCANETGKILRIKAMKRRHALLPYPLSRHIATTSALSFLIAT